jgi:hypothetical protein
MKPKRGRGRPELKISVEEMRRIGRTLPSRAQLAAFFGCSVKTIERRLKTSPELAEALAMGSAEQTGKISTAQQLLAIGYFRCSICRNPLEENADCEKHKGKASERGKHSVEYFREFVPPNPLMLIWLGKNCLGQSDRSFIEQKYKGDPRNIPDEMLEQLLPAALERAGYVTTEKSRTKQPTDEAKNDGDQAAR